MIGDKDGYLEIIYDTQTKRLALILHTCNHDPVFAFRAVDCAPEYSTLCLDSQSQNYTQKVKAAYFESFIRVASRSLASSRYVHD